jgi:tRNA-Thr(GGU) m(6)t(6)A37 methyltransferase TsaA
MNLRPVGVVHSAIRERKQMPAWGAPASVEVFAAFEPGLLRIEKHSHLWVLAWLDQTGSRDAGEERAVLRVTPRGVTDPGPEGLHGVFAVRSPARPNPIGLTAARVLRQEGRVLHLDRLDFLDGTPVIDLKPYFITRDLIFSANGRQVGSPRSREDLRESLTAQAVQFHGRLTADLAVGIRVVEHYRFTFHEMNDVEHWSITAPLDRPEVVDALLGLTRATPGRGNLHFGSSNTVEINGAEYCLQPAAGRSPEETLALPDGVLFQVAAP